MANMSSIPNKGPDQPVDFAQQTLAPVQTDDDTKAQAWEAYHNSSSLADFESRISKLDLPDSIKADLWEGANMRFNAVANRPGMPAAAPMETSGLGTAYSAATRAANTVVNAPTSGFASANRGGEFTGATPDQSSSLVTGAEKGLTESLSGTSQLAGKATSAVGLTNPGSGILGEAPASAAETKPSGTGENVGYGLEGLGEFIAGDEALKGLGFMEKAEKSLKAWKAAKTAAGESPLVARALEIGMNMLRSGVVGGAQSAAHGADLTTSLESGGLTAAAGGAVDIVGEALKALRPVSKSVAGVEVPVRASVENPTVANKIGEFAANKPALQGFDILQTQPAAREAIGNIATEANKQTASDVIQTLSQGTPTGVKGLSGVTTGQFDNILNVAEEASKPVSDFRDFYGRLKNQLHSFYQKADALNPGFKVAQDAEQAAKATFDSGAASKAVEQQRAIFDQANGNGMFDKVRSLYTRVDALEKIGSKLESLGVVKNTPSDFLPMATEGGTKVDPGLIDGSALRRAVRELSLEREVVNGKPMSVFERAGVPQKSVQQLQELGALLERSRVQEGMKLGRMSPVKAGAAGGVLAGAAELAVSHAIAGLGAVAGPVGAASAAGGLGVNKFLGYVMTHPQALDKLLPAVRSIVAGSTAQITHTYDPETNSLTPVQ